VRLPDHAGNFGGRQITGACGIRRRGDLTGSLKRVRPRQTGCLCKSVVCASGELRRLCLGGGGRDEGGFCRGWPFVCGHLVPKTQAGFEQTQAGGLAIKLLYNISVALASSPAGSTHRSVMESSSGLQCVAGDRGESLDFGLANTKMEGRNSATLKPRLETDGKSRAGSLSLNLDQTNSN
jgi:hypothetical protein